MLESLNLPDISLMENITTALAAIAGFALAFGQRIWSALKTGLARIGRPFSGLWLRLRIMVASKRLYDHLYAVLAAEIRAAGKAGRNITDPALEAIACLKAFEADLEAPQKPKPRRSPRKRRTGERLTTPAEKGSGEEGVKAQPKENDRRFATPAEDAPDGGAAPASA